MLKAEREALLNELGEAMSTARAAGHEAAYRRYTKQQWGEVFMVWPDDVVRPSCMPGDHAAWLRPRECLGGEACRCWR